jgi:hypothetical protein
VDSPKQVTLDGRLVIDYLRNTVIFSPLIKGEAFQLPLAPLDVDIAMRLSEYAKTKTAK